MRTTLTRLSVIALMSAASAASAAGDPPPPPAAPATHTTMMGSSDAPKMKSSMNPDDAQAVKEGWNTDWALLFSVGNFIGANNGFLNPPQTGSIAAEYFLSDTTAVRVGVTLARNMSPPQITKTVTTTGATTVNTYLFNPNGNTEQDAITLRGEYLMRLIKGPIAPYIGGGAQLTAGYQRVNYVDDVSQVDQRTEIDNHAFQFDFTVRGVVGAEWRVHPNFAFYADYNVNLSLFNSNLINQRTTVENTVGGTTSTTQTTNQRTVNTWLQLNTGISQGAALGLKVFF